MEIDSQRNIHYVHQNKYGPNFWGIFHSKLMLLQFDDRLRVVISSANLYRFDWELISQVIWFQDFFPSKTKNHSDFEQDLALFMERVKPKQSRKQVYAKEIELKNYDFSTAKVKIVGSVHGRHTGDDLNLFGINRLSEI